MLLIISPHIFCQWLYLCSNYYSVQKDNNHWNIILTILYNHSSRFIFYLLHGELLLPPICSYVSSALLSLLSLAYICLAWAGNKKMRTVESTRKRKPFILATWQEENCYWTNCSCHHATDIGSVIMKWNILVYNEILQSRMKWPPP